MDSPYWQLSEVQGACALRFDGYAYATQVAGPDADPMELLSRLSHQVVETSEFFRDDCDNFAAFFCLQRFLAKWGGESLTPHARETIAFDLLFLQLYRQPTPEAYINATYDREWQECLAAGVESLAAEIRRSLSRAGNGPVVVV